MSRIVLVMAALALVVGAQANLYNGDMEFQPGPKFSSLEGWNFGMQGGWADHAGFAAPNNGTLGLNFGFYSVDFNQILAQESTLVFAPSTSYTFTSWAVGGGGDTVTIPYQIGYLSGGTHLDTNFVPLATFLDSATGKGAGGQWELQDGVTYMTGAAGPEIGLNVVVRFGGVNQGGGGGGGAWVDSATLTPEPASLVLLAAGLLLRRR